MRQERKLRTMPHRRLATLARLLITAALPFVLAGCETFGTSITDEQLTKVNKVGLVSLVDDQISYNHVALTAFGNRDTLYPFPALDIDTHITDSLSSALRRANPKVDVIPIKVDFQQFRAAYKRQESLASLDTNRFISLISAQASSLGLQHIIVASRDSIQFDQAPIAVNGIGLRTRSGQDAVGSFVLIKLQLLDVLTKQEIAKARVFERNRDSAFSWLEPFDKNTTAQKSKLKDYFYESITEWSKRAAATLIQSPKDFRACSEVVYNAGFEISGTTYRMRDDVLEKRAEHIKRRVLEEGATRKEAMPPFEEQFQAQEEKILDCLAQLE